MFSYGINYTLIKNVTLETAATDDYRLLLCESFKADPLKLFKMLVLPL